MDAKPHRQPEEPPRSGPDGHYGNFMEYVEHGHLWIECKDCGAQWAIVQTSRGEDFEQVSDGDGYCEESWQ